MRICLIYDHLFPQTIGGMERWMRDLALRLAGLGHEVTYLTMRHWPPEDPPDLPGVEVVGLVDPGRIYSDTRRTIGPPVGFGLAVAKHLALHGRNYDVVHTASFPYFPLLAAGAFRRRGGYRIVADWPEVWTLGYWRHYAGLVSGTVGWLVQRACVRVPHQAHCMSRMHAARLVAEGYPHRPAVLPGLYEGPTEFSPADEVNGSLVVYAGRHVREKRLTALIAAFARAHAARPDLRLDIYGDGPDRPRVERAIRDLALEEHVSMKGRQPEQMISSALANAACVATASEREGYGLIVVEAAAHGTPSVVVAGPENASTELVVDGVNGAIALTAGPEDLGGAILEAINAGTELRASTAEWFVANSPRLRLDESLRLVVQEYEQRSPGPPTRKRGAVRRPTRRDPLRLLLVSANFYPSVGGIERFVEVLAHGLAARGHTVTVAACRTDHAPAEEQVDGIRIVRIPSTDVLHRRLNVPYPIPDPVAAFRILRRLVREADLVHPHDALYSTSVISLALAHHQQVPSVLTQHVAFVPQHGRVLDLIQVGAIRTLGRSARLATEVVTYNPAVADWARTTWKLAKVRVLAPGVPDAPAVDRDALRRAFGLPTDRFVALFVGRDVPKKGLDIFLEASDPKFHMLVVSDRAAKRMPDGVQLLPFMEPTRLRELMCCVDAFVLPSEGEGFPFALQEALVSGLPCVVASGPGYDRYLREGEALLVRRDPADIRAALLRLVQDEPLRAQLAAKARAAGRREFSVEKSVLGYEEIYYEAIGAQTFAPPGSGL